MSFPRVLFLMHFLSLSTSIIFAQNASLNVGFPVTCPSLPAIVSSSKVNTISSPARAASDKLVARAVSLLRTPSQESVTEAIILLEQALKTDTGNAMAFARLSAAHGLSTRYANVPADISAERSWISLSKALSLDPDLVFTLNQLANAVIYHMRDYSCAEKIFLRALQIEPGNADTHFNYANLLGSQGKFKVAFQHRDLSIQYADSVTRDRLMMNSGRLRYMAHDYQWVIDHYSGIIAEKPANAWLAHFYKGLALARQGKFDQALAEQKLATPALKGDAGGVANLARAYAQAGDTANARIALQEVLDRDARGEHVVEYQIATVYEALGDDAQAFRWLNKSLDEGDGIAGWLMWLNQDPRWNRLRNDSRFKEILIRAGFGK